MKKLWNFFKAAWKDPVGSKIIFAVLAFFAATILAKYEKKTGHDIYEMISRFLNKPIPLYLILSLIGIYFLFRFVVKNLKKKTNTLYSEKIGDYTFKELCLVLQHKNNNEGFGR